MMRFCVVAPCCLFMLTWPLAVEARLQGFSIRHRRSFADWFASLLSDKVCYHEEGIGCFDNKKPFDYAQNLLPDPPEMMGLEYLLYTRSNRLTPQTLVATPTSIRASNYNGSIDTKVIIHGYQDSGRKHWVTKMKDALLTRDDMNVVVVDWREGAKDLIYSQVAANIRVVGAMVAMFLKALHTSSSATYESMHLIGQSIGAHAAGFVGSRIKGLGRISGLDPAGPLFERKSTKIKLDASDAAFVDVIHTDGDPLTKLAFGIEEAIGDVDFYPNGGNDQPGCEKDFAKHLINLFKGKGVKGLKSNVICSHMRVTHLFTESINSKCKFTAFKCRSKTAFKKRQCNELCNSTCTEMGYNASKGKTKGVFYLRTSNAAPFCLPPV